jgi:hypothetical protein
MYIKIHNVPDGIPRCSVVVSQGQQPNGAWQVNLFVKSHDCYDVGTVCASLRLSVAEARALAACLLAETEKCEESSAEDRRDWALEDKADLEKEGG